MKSVIVTIKNKNKPILKKMKRTLIWYDPIKREMQVFEGGQLSFEYREDDYLKERGDKNIFRMLPEVIDLEERGFDSVSNKDDIIKWFNNYLNYNDSEAEISIENPDGIVFVVPNEESDDFVYQLERNGFIYSI
ncbi:hypothetical protein LCGC14_1543630 [marine sediment metagenome]|uniref:Uncharacterized protein n=1 Tax=marine sediment metagenome TaxID=412755 RepID=A0A0F9ISF9_9ZZZZ